MPYYTYLISSLPALCFGMRPPFSFEGLLGLCKELVLDKDIEVLQIAYNAGLESYQGTQQTLNKWYEFELTVRNELAKIRAGRKHLDPAKYLRRDGFVEPGISHIALAAFRNPNILEAERYLDQMRWQFLDGLLFGHYFDLDFLIVYSCKLKILERWEKINAVNKDKLLEEVYAN